MMASFHCDLWKKFVEILQNLYFFFYRWWKNTWINFTKTSEQYVYWTIRGQGDAEAQCCSIAIKTSPTIHNAEKKNVKYTESVKIIKYKSATQDV